MNDLLIYGDIGWENTAKQVQEKLNEFDGAPVRVLSLIHISEPTRPY